MVTRTMIPALRIAVAIPYVRIGPRAKGRPDDPPVPPVMADVVVVPQA
jgi:hypothetical protein